MTTMHRTLPWIVAVLAVAFLLAQAWRESMPGPFDLDRFAAIPVSADGRVKPMDTVARTSLMIISGRQSFELNGERQPAIRWLADVMGQRAEARDYPVFRIDHPDVQSLIGQDASGSERFSLRQIMPHFEAVTAQAERAGDVPSRRRNAFQRQVLQLYRQIGIFMDLTALRAPYLIPPTADNSEWAPFDRVFQEARATGQPNAAANAVADLMSAYHEQDAPAFNQRVADYHSRFDEQMPEAALKAQREVFFNGYQPFYLATVLYVLAFLVACASLLLRCTRGSAWADTLGRTAFWLLVVTFALHTFGLAMRIYLQGRPPVTNLYSSAVFVGWGSVLLALFVERFHRLALASLAAAGVGFATLIVAHNLAGDGDTMEMMQAVLDSNFWLATHVTIIAIGYSATFLAGLMGIVFIALGVFTPWLTPSLNQAITKMVYGTVCFALLFSFTGTVLGGIWADQSWGRFWGWDPKENGAALIVLMHALILHARWGGMIKARGMMVLVVAGNIITAWAWFGTNMLGVGLHSYGFMDSAMAWLFAFVLSQLAIIGVGLLPPEAWRSPLTRAAARA